MLLGLGHLYITKTPVMSLDEGSSGRTRCPEGVGVARSVAITSTGRVIGRLRDVVEEGTRQDISAPVGLSHFCELGPVTHFSERLPAPASRI